MIVNIICKLTRRESRTEREREKMSWEFLPLVGFLILTLADLGWIIIGGRSHWGSLFALKCFFLLRWWGKYSSGIEILSQFSHRIKSSGNTLTASGFSFSSAWASSFVCHHPLNSDLTRLSCTRLNSLSDKRFPSELLYLVSRDKVNNYINWETDLPEIIWFFGGWDILLRFWY
jgi:hypothetical protein